jgi:hypothetical protein
METTKPASKKTLLTGRIISGLCILFLLFDAVTKIAKAKQSMDGSLQLGWPQDSVQVIGILLLICTILYVIPRTAVVGAILIAAYLGGATSIMYRAAMPGHPYIFPIVFGVLTWVGLALQRPALRVAILQPNS